MYINMISFLEIIFQSFWHFAGTTLLLSMVLKFIQNIWTIFWRHYSIRKHGYPTAGCDVDGTFIKCED